MQSRSRVEEKKIHFFSDGLRISGFLCYPPEVPSPVPAIIFLHGFTSHKDEDRIETEGVGMFRYAAYQFAKAGFASLRFDFRGHGDSQGLFEELRISDLTTDTLAAVAFIAKHTRIDNSRLSLIGQSLGGLVAAYAAHRDHRIKSAVLWNAPSNPLHTFSSILGCQSLHEVFDKGRISFPWEDKGRFSLKGDFFIENITSSPLLEIAKFCGPLLIIVGTKDEYIYPQPQMGMAYIHAHRGRNNLIELESDHTFSIRDAGVKFIDQAIHQSLLWLRRQEGAEAI